MASASSTARAIYGHWAGASRRMTRCFCDRSTGDALIFVVSKSCSGGQMSEDGIQVTLHSAKLEVEEYNSS